MSTGLKTLQSYTFFNGNMLKNLQNHITIAPLNIKIQKKRLYRYQNNTPYRKGIPIDMDFDRQ